MSPTRCCVVIEHRAEHVAWARERLVRDITLYLYPGRFIGDRTGNFSVDDTVELTDTQIRVNNGHAKVGALDADAFDTLSHWLTVQGAGSRVPLDGHM